MSLTRSQTGAAAEAFPLGSARVPSPQRSVRPPDLPPGQREALRSVGPGPRKPRRADGLVLVISALVLAFLIKTFLVQAFYIPSGSMIPTLDIGDRVLVEKVGNWFGEPSRGEVVVFRRPGVSHPNGVGRAVRSFFEGLGLAQPDADIDLIKRVMGLPGETVELRGGVLYVDGSPLDEPYIVADQRDFGPIVVPEGELFMLGDNRGNSDDSRYSLGTVPIDNVVGRAFVVLWPPERARLLAAPW